MRSTPLSVRFNATLRRYCVSGDKFQATTILRCRGRRHARPARRCRGRRHARLRATLARVILDANGQRTWQGLRGQRTAQLVALPSLANRRRALGRHHDNCRIWDFVLDRPQHDVTVGIEFDLDRPVVVLEVGVRVVSLEGLHYTLREVLGIGRSLVCERAPADQQHPAPLRHRVGASRLSATRQYGALRQLGESRSGIFIHATAGMPSQRGSEDVKNLGPILAC